MQRDVVASYLDSGSPVDEQGVEDAFELLHEMNERVRTGIWVGDCFIYSNSSWRLNYCVGGEVFILFPFRFKRALYLFIELSVIIFSLSSWISYMYIYWTTRIIQFLLLHYIMDLGYYNVSFGPSYVLVGISCQPK